MAELKVGKGEWIVVCDGTKALVLENVGNSIRPKLRTKEVYEQPDPKTHEQGSDAPGRVFNSVGTARGAVEQTDWHDATERAFLEKLVSRLDAAVTAGKTKSLIIVAPPRALGMIRRAYSPRLRGVVRAELDKDLTKQPVHEIAKHLAA